MAYSRGYIFILGTIFLYYYTMRAHFNFTGASGTGKTTALDLLKKQLPSTYRIHTNVIRDLASQKGLTLNELATEQTQNLIFEAYENILHDDKDVEYVNDRCVIDPVAYTMYLVANNKLDRSILDAQWMKLKTAVSEGLLEHVFYFPVNFPLVKDGVRSENECYRKEIDASIRGVLEGLEMLYPDKFSYTTVKGTPEEIVEQILNA